MDSSIDNLLIDGIRYTCSFEDCGLQFKRKDQLDSHEYTHNQIRKFPCTEGDCTKSYVNNAHLQRHKRTAHTKNPSKQLLYCTGTDCAAYFDSTAKLKSHLLKVHGGVQREYICEHCDVKFVRKSKLRLHMFTHTGNYRYRCDACDKGFFQMGHLTRHQKTHAQRKCDKCEEIFTKWSLLMAHKRTAHTTEDENKCGVCGKVCQSKRSLKYHSKVHVDIGDRMVFECTFVDCPKFFFKRSSMLAHYKSTHENKKFICTVEGCERELSTKQKLNNHVKVVHDKNSSDRTKLKIKCNRAKRKDKGVQKTSTASKLFNIYLPKEFEEAIISGNGNKISFHYDPNSIDPDINEMETSSTCKASTVDSIGKSLESIECCN